MRTADVSKELTLLNLIREVVAWAAFLVSGYVVRAMILGGLYASQALSRSEALITLAGFLLALLGSFALAYTYVKGYQGGYDR
jgi:hypothetical protein